MKENILISHQYNIKYVILEEREVKDLVLYKYQSEDILNLK